MRRSTEVKPVKTTFRVYTEGAATEPEYLDLLRRLPEVSSAISLDITVEESGATPLHLVDSACQAKKKSDLDIDQYWCMFDVESPKAHPHLSAARQKARDNDVLLAISNPCFELWLALHHKYVSRHVSTEEAVKLRSSLDGSDSKHLDADLYRPLIGVARANEKRLREKHLKDGTQFPDDNPSTSIGELITMLMETAERLLDDSADSPGGT